MRFRSSFRGTKQCGYFIYFFVRKRGFRQHNVPLSAGADAPQVGPPLSADAGASQVGRVLSADADASQVGPPLSADADASQVGPPLALLVRMPGR
jgi:hypothetical protein